MFVVFNLVSAINFNDVTSWSTAENGGGTTPTNYLNADEFVIDNSSLMTLTRTIYS